MMHTHEQFLRSLQIHADGTPIYVQLREQLLGAIGRGELAPGAQLPTMREMAVALRVDLHTVQRAYAALERDGAAVTQRGRGTFVADAPPLLDPRLIEARIEALAHRTIAAARSSGLDPARLGARLLELSVDPPQEN